MSYAFDEAKLRIGSLRKAVEGEPCEVDGSEERMGMVPEDEKYAIHLLTPTYELTPGIVQALHREGPYGVRHLGKVSDRHNKHVWLLVEQD